MGRGERTRKRCEARRQHSRKFQGGRAAGLGPSDDGHCRRGDGGHVHDRPQSGAVLGCAGVEVQGRSAVPHLALPQWIPSIRGEQVALRRAGGVAEGGGGAPGEVQGEDGEEGGQQEAEQARRVGRCGAGEAGEGEGGQACLLQLEKVLFLVPISLEKVLF